MSPLAKANSEKLLEIIDECFRNGNPKMLQIFLNKDVFRKTLRDWKEEGFILCA